MNKRLKRVWTVSLLLLAAVVITVPVQAAQVGWTQWTSKTFGSPGMAEGTITLPGGGTVNVTYTGELFSAGDQGNWNQAPGTYTLAGVVDNQPNPANVSIQLRGGNSILNQIVFSTPVLDPIMAIQSLGSGDRAVYSFAEPFTILAQGPGHWGGGSTSLSQSGNSLIGNEGNGIIRFAGAHSSISWTVPDGEFYHMFTVGAASSAVPEPTTMLLLGLGLIGVAGVRRKMHK